MQENDMFVIGTNAKKNYLKRLERKKNILNREFDVSRPNEVWVSDVTELKFKHKKIRTINYTQKDIQKLKEEYIAGEKNDD